MQRLFAFAVAALVLAATSLPGHALMRGNAVNPDYKFGKFQAGAATHGTDMTKPAKPPRKAKRH